AAKAWAVARRFPDLVEVGGVGRARDKHARVLRREITRAAGNTASAAPTTTPAAPAVPPDKTAAVHQVSQSLDTAQRNASAMVSSLPRYRAGLVGSVAAGCASLREALT
ncbi:MAG: hypothetical protein ACRDRL_30560, partial [Sciscionella sp.]